MTIKLKQIAYKLGSQNRWKGGFAGMDAPDKAGKRGKHE